MAQVVPLADYAPFRGDRLFVDASAWLFVVFPALSSSETGSRIARSYGDFVARCSRVGAALYYSPLSLSEIANRVEKYYFEFEIRSQPNLNRKEFRSVPTEREKVCRAIRSCWNQITSIAECLDVSIDAEGAAAALAMIETTALDGYDPYYIAQMQRHKISNVLTHDRDFVSIPNLIIASALSQN